MSKQETILYSPGDVLAKERELAEWEERLRIARENVLNATSRNYRTTVVSWGNIKNVVSHLRCQLGAMRKAMRS